MSHPLREAILAALDAIPDPLEGRGLVAAGRVIGLEISPAGQVRFALEAPAGEAARYAPVRVAAEAAAAGQKGVSSAQVVLTSEAAPEGRTRVRKGAPLPPAPPPPPRRAEGIAGVRHLLAVSSAKGGVGKSTIAVNLAVAMAALGQRVGLLDADVYGPSAPTLLGLAAARPEMRPGGKLIPLEAWGLKAMSIGFIVEIDAPMIWRGPMATSAVGQMLDDVDWAPLDVLVIDMPPGTGDVQLTLAQRLPLSGAVIISTPQEMALADARRGIAMFERTHVPILGVVENMSWIDLPGGGRLHPFGEGGARRTAEASNVRFLGALPLEPALRESADAGRPLAADSHPLSDRFRELAAEVLGAMAEGGKPAPTIRFV